MSIDDLCSQDTLLIETPTVVPGDSFGVTSTFKPSQAISVRCLGQEPSARQILDFQARGMRLDIVFFFSTDPGISNEHRLAWQGKFVRVLAAKKEGRPGEDLLWVVFGEFVDTRMETPTY